MITNSKLAFVDEKSENKEEVFKQIANVLKKEKFIKNKDKLVEGLLKRENEFSTGIGEGFAIPHTINEEIAEPKIVFVRLGTPVEWNSIDEKPVDTIISIIVPKNGRQEHFKIIQVLSSNLMKNVFKNQIKSISLNNVVKIFNGLEIEEKKTQETKTNLVSNDIKEKKYIIGITSCPTGIAHTFMAKQKIVDSAREKGYDVKIETQGADGIKNKLTIDDIKNADGIIISSSVALDLMERFEGYEDKIFYYGIQEIIIDSDYAIDQSILVAKNFNQNNNFNKNSKNKLNSNFDEVAIINSGGRISSIWKTGMNHVMTGIGAMIPVLLIAGFLMAIGNIGALPWTIDGTNTKPISDSTWATYSNFWVNIMYYTNQVGTVLMKFMYPVFAMYLAYSIGGKLALIPGFLGGIMSQGIIADYADNNIFSSIAFSWAYPNGFVPSGFFGAIVIGFFVGYFAKYLNEKIQFQPNLIALKTMLIIPLLLTIFTAFSMMFLINPIFGQLNYRMQRLFISAGDGGMYLYQTLISAGTAFDLGGPFNKAAGAVANPFNADAIQLLNETLNWATSTTVSDFNGVMNDGLSTVSPEELTVINDSVSYVKTFNITGRTLSIIIPPIGVGTAVLLGNSITKRDLFTKEDQQVGATSVFLGVIGISEGAIPFMLKWPFIIIFANIIGSVLGTSIALTLGSIQQLPLPAIWGWFLVGTTTPSGAYGFAPLYEQIIGYVFGLIFGVLVTASIIIFALYYKNIKSTKKIKFIDLNILEDKYERYSIEELINKKSFKKKIFKIQNAINYSKQKIDDQFKINKIEKDIKEILDDDILVSELNISFNKLSYEINKMVGKLPKERFKEMKYNNKIEIIDHKIENINSKNENIDVYKDKGMSKYEKVEQKIYKLKSKKLEQENKIRASKKRQELIKEEIEDYLNNKYELILKYQYEFNKLNYPIIKFNSKNKKYYI